MYMYMCKIFCDIQWNHSNPDTFEVSLLARCPDFRGFNVHKQEVCDSEMCLVYRGVLTSLVCPKVPLCTILVGNNQMWRLQVHLLWINSSPSIHKPGT